MSHICMLKAQLAQLRRQEIENQMKGTGGGGDGWDVKAPGDARVGLIGFPSVGKSTLLTKMTGTHSGLFNRSLCLAVSISDSACPLHCLAFRGGGVRIYDAHLYSGHYP